MDKVKVNQEKCIGCGLCASLCSEVFEMKDDKSEVKKGADFRANEKCINETVESCPVSAIEKP